MNEGSLLLLVASKVANVGLLFLLLTTIFGDQKQQARPKSLSLSV
jgi:hypothetical protein